MLEIEKKQTIIKAGEISSDLYFVIRGKVKLGSTLLRHSQPFGGEPYLTLAGQDPSYAKNIVAERGVALLVISKDGFECDIFYPVRQFILEENQDREFNTPSIESNANKRLVFAVNALDKCY